MGTGLGGLRAKEEKRLVKAKGNFGAKNWRHGSTASAQASLFAVAIRYCFSFPSSSSSSSCASSKFSSVSRFSNNNNKPTVLNTKRLYNLWRVRSPRGKYSMVALQLRSPALREKHSFHATLANTSHRPLLPSRIWPCIHLSGISRIPTSMPQRDGWATKSMRMITGPSCSHFLSDLEIAWARSEF